MEMKVISLNLNGIRSAAKKGVFEWIDSQKPDFVCFQETKAQVVQLDQSIINPDGWSTGFSDAKKKGYSGVAIYSKKNPLNVSKSFGFEEADNEGRFIRFDFENFSIVSVYFPSGSSSPERQSAKYQFMDRFEDWLSSKKQQLKNFIICGDWNIAHNEIDLKNWKGNKKNSGFLPEERAWLDKIFKKFDLSDAYRLKNPDKVEYTWWSNRGRAWENNVGWRIDYQIVGSSFAARIQSSETYKTTRFSDHAPVIINYKF